MRVRHVPNLALVGILFLSGCVTPSVNKKEAKIPEKYRTVLCSKVIKVGNGSIPDQIGDKFIKQKGKFAYIYTEWYDLTPHAQYVVRWDYFRKSDFIASSIKEFTSYNHKYMTAGQLNLDPKYQFPTGIITTKIYVNDVYVTEATFLLATDREEMAKLEPEFEKSLAEHKAAERTREEPGRKVRKPISPSATRDGQGWAVIIGISEYQYAGRNGLTNLIFADDDARAFARVLRNLGWDESHFRVLVNGKATQRNIMIALESWLTKAGPQDQIILFWAGHGFHDPEDPEKVYFACHDTDLSIPATGYRMDRVRTTLEEHSCRNVVLFSDTCHAGKLITRGDRGLSIIPGIEKIHRDQKTPKGWVFMVGADSDRKAIEHSSWTNGAFTHCLIRGLSGEADGYLSAGDMDGVVTMGELRTYLNDVMPDETQKVLGVAKRPVITTSSGDPDIWGLTLQAGP